MAAKTLQARTDSRWQTIQVFLEQGPHVAHVSKSCLLSAPPTPTAAGTSAVQIKHADAWPLGISCARDMEKLPSTIAYHFSGALKFIDYKTDVKLHTYIAR